MSYLQLQEKPWRDGGFGTAWSVLQTLLLLAAGLFFCLHFVHLKADFPSNSPWMDWAKYTDEGWYGDAAIRHFQLGSWYVPGDFNPAAALPVWPLIEAVVFRFTGVGVVAARALTVVVFGLTLVCSYLLLGRWARGRATLAPAAAVVLLAVSPFCYAFTRMAILEPLLVLLTATSLLVASAIEVGAASRLRRLWPLVALGLLLPLMVLTKTTAVFLFPAVFWMVWARVGYRWRLLLRTAAVPAGIGALLWAAYFGLVVRPHFLGDYRYLFSANAYTGMTPENARQVLVDTVKDGMWIGPVVFPLALLLAIVALLRWRLLLRNPLTVSLLLWAGGYAAFLAYHDNLQPRYYLVVAVPLTLLIPVVLEGIWQRTRDLRGRAPVVAMAGVLLTVAVTDAQKTLRLVRTPQYTFISAAQRIRDIVQSDPNHSRLVLSISGSDLSLMTGIPSICDDFGTLELEQRVAAYRPGWYVSWNQVDDDKMDALTPMYHLERVAAFPAMDDPERNLLILYRLDPATDHPARRPRHRKPTPRLLRTRLGQQPSVTQLVH
ncbi:MAG: hypothetical protein NVSMB3_06940 [Acidobacteriaceae bacterium]